MTAPQPPSSLPPKTDSPEPSPVPAVIIPTHRHLAHLASVCEHAFRDQVSIKITPEFLLGLCYEIHRQRATEQLMREYLTCDTDLHRGSPEDPDCGVDANAEVAALMELRRRLLRCLEFPPAQPLASALSALSSAS